MEGSRRERHDKTDERPSLGGPSHSRDRTIRHDESEQPQAHENTPPTRSASKQQDNRSPGKRPGGFRTVVPHSSFASSKKGTGHALERVGHQALTDDGAPEDDRRQARHPAP